MSLIIKHVITPRTLLISEAFLWGRCMQWRNNIVRAIRGNIVSSAGSRAREHTYRNHAPYASVISLSSISITRNERVHPLRITLCAARSHPSPVPLPDKSRRRARPLVLELSRRHDDRLDSQLLHRQLRLERFPHALGTPDAQNKWNL